MVDGGRAVVDGTRDRAGVVVDGAGVVVDGAGAGRKRARVVMGVAGAAVDVAWAEHDRTGVAMYVARAEHDGTGAAAGLALVRILRGVGGRGGVRRTPCGLAADEVVHRFSRLAVNPVLPSTEREEDGSNTEMKVKRLHVPASDTQKGAEPFPCFVCSASSEGTDGLFSLKTCIRSMPRALRRIKKRFPRCEERKERESFPKIATEKKCIGRVQTESALSGVLARELNEGKDAGSPCFRPAQPRGYVVNSKPEGLAARTGQGATPALK